jgi:uncharacterized membrane protein (DUF485 family)
MHDVHHEREQEHPETVAFNTRLGLVLFVIYLALYASYLGISTWSPATMGSAPFGEGGVNLAIIFGFGLIVAALVLAVVYLLLCRATPVAAAKQGG